MSALNSFAESMKTEIDEFEAAARDKRAVLLELLTVRQQIQNAIPSERKEGLLAREIDLQVAHEAATDRMRVADMRFDAAKSLGQAQATAGALTDAMEKMYAMQVEEPTPNAV